MAARIAELLANSQAAGEQGNVDAAQAAATQADIVKVCCGNLLPLEATQHQSISQPCAGLAKLQYT